jgi:hypothetical protein
MGETTEIPRLEVWETPDGSCRWEILGWREWPGREDRQADCVQTMRGLGVLRGLVWYSEITSTAQRIAAPPPTVTIPEAELDALKVVVTVAKDASAFLREYAPSLREDGFTIFPDAMEKQADDLDAALAALPVERRET